MTVDNKKRIGLPYGKYIIATLVVFNASLSYSAYDSYNKLKSDFEIYRDAIEQSMHDVVVRGMAEFRALDSVATVSEDGGGAAFKELAGTYISNDNFTPWIAVYELPKSPSSSAYLSFMNSVPENGGDRLNDDMKRNFATLSPGEATGYPDPRRKGYIYFAYRSKKSDNRNIVVALHSVNLFTQFANVDKKISMEIQLGGVNVLERSAHLHGEIDNFFHEFLPSVEYSFQIGNKDGGFSTNLYREFTLGELLPAALVLRAMFISLVTACVICFGIAQNSRIRAAQKERNQILRRNQIIEREAEMAQMTRVNEVGELASGIIHELSQPIGSLLNQSQAGLKMLHVEISNPSDLTKLLFANEREARRAKEIIQRIRGYIQKRNLDDANFELNVFLKNLSEYIFDELSSKGVSLDIGYSPSLIWVNASPIELEQIIRNIVKNGVDSMNDNEKNDRLITINLATESEHALIRVTDNGRGMSEDVLARIFQPFFTTKETGTGLGLSLCKRMLMRVNGSISAANREDGKGAVFSIKLPLTLRS